MLKKTYSPLSTIFKSSAASIISLIVPGLAHIITTVMDFVNKYVIIREDFLLESHDFS